jgi:serine/threonine protein kinase
VCCTKNHSGYFAEVRKGIDKTTGETVAIKVVDKKKVEREETLNNEIEILSAVDHPSIVRMYAIFDTPEHLLIVMELCVLCNRLCLLFRMEGGELYEEIIARTVFTEQEAATIVRQLLEALKYLHAKGIVHRDLKVRAEKILEC